MISDAKAIVLAIRELTFAIYYNAERVANPNSQTADGHAVDMYDEYATAQLDEWIKAQ